MMLHCVKSVQIRSFFWSVFSCIRTKYRFYPVNLRIQFVRIQENIEINSVFRHFTQYQYFEREIVFFFSIRVFFHEHPRFTGQQGKGEVIYFSSSLPLPPASQALRHKSGDYCGEHTSARSWQRGSNREPLVSELKSITTELRALKDRVARLSLFQPHAQS